MQKILYVSKENFALRCSIFFSVQNLSHFADWHSNTQNILVGFCNNHLKIWFLLNFLKLFLLYHLSRTLKFWH